MTLPVATSSAREQGRRAMTDVVTGGLIGGPMRSGRIGEVSGGGREPHARHQEAGTRRCRFVLRGHGFEGSVTAASPPRHLKPRRQFTRSMTNSTPDALAGVVGSR